MVFFNTFYVDSQTCRRNDNIEKYRKVLKCTEKIFSEVIQPSVATQTFANQ